MPIISTLAAVAFASSLGMAQDPVWIEERTTQGCLFYLAGIDHGEAAGAPPPFTWSGACQPGAPINGAGVLEARIAYEGDLIVERWTGTMVDGYWHGLVRSERFRSENGGPLEQSSYSYDSWVPTAEATYDMGCSRRLRECPPRRQQRASAPVASEPQGQRIYDTPEEYAASQQRARSRAAGEAAAGNLDNIHNTENDAVTCLELVTLNGAASLQNNCTFTVEAAWCVEGYDCNPGYSNMWSIGAGRMYPVNGSRGGGRVHWGACRGANSLTRRQEDGPFNYRCPDRLQNNR